MRDVILNETSLWIKYMQLFSLLIHVLFEIFLILDHDNLDKV